MDIEVTLSGWNGQTVEVIGGTWTHFRPHYCWIEVSYYHYKRKWPYWLIFLTFSLTPTIRAQNWVSYCMRWRKGRKRVRDATWLMTKWRKCLNSTGRKRGWIALRWWHYGSFVPVNLRWGFGMMEDKLCHVRLKNYMGKKIIGNWMRLCCIMNGISVISIQKHSGQSIYFNDALPCNNTFCEHTRTLTHTRAHIHIPANTAFSKIFSELNHCLENKKTTCKVLCNYL